jgi:hypothetical protein
MNIQTEVYISIDGQIFNKVDLSKNESINMKYVLKDTTELSKIFSPYSLSFNLPGTLNNQRIFGFVGNTKIYKVKTDSIFPCKIYSNGILSQTGKLKLTEIREEFGKVKSLVGNFTTTMLSIQSRMGDDLISSLPIDIQESWTPNGVYEMLKSVKVSPSGIRYYVPLISNSRVFAVNADVNSTRLDNVKFFNGINPISNKCLKTSELSMAISFKSIIDAIRTKYLLDVEMPLDNETHYKDLFVMCNASQTETNTSPITYLKIEPLSAVSRYNVDESNGLHAPNAIDNKYFISSTNGIDFILKRIPSSDKFYDFIDIKIYLNSFVKLKEGSDDVIITLVKSNGTEIAPSVTSQSIGGVVTASFKINDTVINIPSGLDKVIDFKIKIETKSPSTWSNSSLVTENVFYNNPNGPQRAVAYYKQYKSNYPNASLESTNIKAEGFLPKIKCSDFLISFFKIFNISIFDASPNDDKLFWLTPQDLFADNKNYSKKEVDYTPYIVSESVQKKIASDYNYYNFKHKTSKYKSNVDFFNSTGFEFGQTTYPSIKPISDLNEFKVETQFSILPTVSIPDTQGEFTSYGFNSESPTFLETGEARFKPNLDELTIFFGGQLRALGVEKNIAVQGTNNYGALIAKSLGTYVKTSPVHPNGFSLGFSLIEGSLQRSLYFDFYKGQTERLLNPNVLQQSFKLQLPASELVLNYATTGQGQSNIPNGFRLQNDIVIQEQRFSIIDSQIDLTTGKANMNLLNY